MRKIISMANAISSPGNKYLKTTKISQYIPWSKVAGISHGGVDIEKFKPRRKDSALLKKHNLEDKIVILFVGNLLPFKGLHLLNEALFQINDENMVLLVVGAGYGEDNVKKQVDDLKLTDKVIFVGAQSPAKDLHKYYSVCPI